LLVKLSENSHITWQWTLYTHVIDSRKISYKLSTSQSINWKAQQKPTYYYDSLISEVFHVKLMTVDSGCRWRCISRWRRASCYVYWRYTGIRMLRIHSVYVQGVLQILRGMELGHTAWDVAWSHCHQEACRRKNGCSRHANKLTLNYS